MYRYYSTQRVEGSATNSYRAAVDKNAYNRNQAWQRRLTQSAENAARRILGCEGKGGCND